MTGNDETRILRLRRDESAALVDTLRREAPGPVKRLVGRVFSGGSKPTTSEKYYLVHPLLVDGSELEGGSGSLAPDTSIEVAVLLVRGAPPIDADLLCRSVGGRWLAEYSGPGGGGDVPPITLPGCGCAPIPANLTMTSFDETCNAGMFQSCHIDYRVLPPELAALGLGSSAFLSVESFVDSTTGDTFYYYFSCLGSKFSLTRVYPTSIFGSPFREGELYYWTVGVSGNVCSPFSLTNGTAFSGSDLSCDVHITPT